MRGLENLHGLEIAHLGLRSHNILLEKEGQAKIASVGLGSWRTPAALWPPLRAPPCGQRLSRPMARWGLDLCLRVIIPQAAVMPQKMVFA